MSDIHPIRAKLLPKRTVQRETFTRQINRQVSEFEQAVVSARSEIEQTLRRFAKRIQQERAA